MCKTFAPLIGAASAFLASLGLSGAALMMDDPKRFTAIFAYAALFVGAFVCGISAVKLDLQRSMLSSLVGGVGYVLLLWLISLAMRARAEHPVTPLFMLAMYICCVLVSLLGGLSGRGRKTYVDANKKNPTALMRRQLGRR